MLAWLPPWNQGVSRALSDARTLDAAADPAESTLWACACVPDEDWDGEMRMYGWSAVERTSGIHGFQGSSRRFLRYYLQQETDRP